MAREGPAIVVAMALPAESDGRFEKQGIEVLYTGVGKVNAAVALIRRLARHRREGCEPPFVVNFGTAGGVSVPPRTLVACRRFVDRDMDVSPLGFAPGVTPFDALPPVLEFPPCFTGLPEALCGTGDSFATRAQRVACGVVDMEAYALAKVCRIEGAGFACAKYVSDGADHRAAEHWRENVAGAADRFVKLYEELVSRLASGANLA
ncbi:MAG: 5'-nucleosidase [Steroidobacteraceae bacterium]